MHSKLCRVNKSYIEQETGFVKSLTVRLSENNIFMYF